MSLAVRERQALSGFDPRELGSLECWYDAEFVNGFGVAQPNDGDLLAQWNDLSGKGRHVVQAITGSKPMFRVPRVANSPVNLVPNPRLFSSISGWNSNNAGLYPVTRDVVNFHRFNAAAASISVGPTAGTVVGSLYFGTSTVGPNSINVIPGVSYHTSVWVKVSRDSKVNVYVRARDAAGVVVPFTGLPVSNLYTTTLIGAQDFGGPQVAIAAGVWTQLHIITGPVPANAATILQVVAANSNPAVATTAGDAMYCTEALVEPWPNHGQYIDGDLAGGFGWTGTAHLSSTIRKTADPKRVQFNGSNNWLATAGSITGSLPNPTSITGYFVVGNIGQNDTFTNMRLASTTNTDFIIYSSLLWGLLLAGGGGAAKSYKLGDVQVFSAWSDPVNTSAQINGSALTVSARASAQLGGVLVLGGHIGSVVLNGSISAALIFSEKHDEIKRHQVEQWLAARYGVPLLRP
jgi:hypothetical protein